MKLLCAQPPNLMDIDKLSDVDFANVQLVEVVSRTLAELASTAGTQPKSSEAGLPAQATWLDQPAHKETLKSC